MVKVFKTNVTSMIDANLIIQSLINIYPKCKINFDLDDCDKILRIEGGEIDNDHIVCLLNEAKFECKEIYD